jgi:hypothetical protein
MERLGLGLRWVLAVWGIAPLVAAGSPVSPSEEKAAVIIRLVHPDRQAAEVLRLFEGSRWSHPAAALVAWKQANPGPSPLGKPGEVLIALANPDMVREWRALHDAELNLDFDPGDGSPHWFATVPRDDGTVAAAITAMRLSYPEDEPIAGNGREIPVARLSRSGVPVACQLGAMLILGSSRAELVRGLRRQPTPLDPPAGGRTANRALDSRITFCLTPGLIATPRGGSLGLRRAVEALHGIGCRRIEGSAALRGQELRVDATTVFDSSRPPDRAGGMPPGVDPAWLEGIPASHVMAVVALAIDPQAASWDRAFALADRLERVDPARAGMAPLRTRLNLLATAAGVQAEADLWPHLRGISACILAQPAAPGRPAGVLVMLHLDAEAHAGRLVENLTPRLTRLLPAGAAGKDPRSGLDTWRRDRSMLIAWGDHQTLGALKTNGLSGRSLAAVCRGWEGEGRGAPQRLIACWPGRLWPVAGGLDPTPAARRALADDPPAVWWGWSTAAGAEDCLRWPGLSGRVRRFLETIPLDPPLRP